MYPNTVCPHDCYRPGDCDGSCTHPEPRCASTPLPWRIERDTSSVSEPRIRLVGANGDIVADNEPFGNQEGDGVMYDEDLAEEYRNEQSYFNSLSAIPRHTATSVPRYFKGMDCPDSTTADVVYIDRLTGKEVMRYDGADPANTRFDYGATPDVDYFAREGRDIKEMIDPSAAVISIDECNRHMRVDFSDDGYWPDDDWGDE